MTEGSFVLILNDPFRMLDMAIRAMNMVDAIGACPGWRHRALQLLAKEDIAKALDRGLSEVRYAYERKTKASYEIIASAGADRDKQIESLLGEIAGMYRAAMSADQEQER